MDDSPGFMSRDPHQAQACHAVGAHSAQFACFISLFSPTSLLSSLDCGLQRPSHQFIAASNHHNGSRYCTIQIYLNGYAASVLSSHPMFCFSLMLRTAHDWPVVSFSTMLCFLAFATCLVLNSIWILCICIFAPHTYTRSLSLFSEEYTAGMLIE